MDRVGSVDTNAGRRVAGAASVSCRCSGGRNAQPAGGTGGEASVTRRSLRCQGHRMRQRPSLILVLIAAISCT